jgi:hypothetical protein
VRPQRVPFAARALGAALTMRPDCALEQRAAHDLPVMGRRATSVWRLRRASSCFIYTDDTEPRRPSTSSFQNLLPRDGAADPASAASDTARSFVPFRAPPLAEAEPTSR